MLLLYKLRVKVKKYNIRETSKKLEKDRTIVQFWD